MVDDHLALLLIPYLVHKHLEHKNKLVKNDPKSNYNKCFCVLCSTIRQRTYLNKHYQVIILANCCSLIRPTEQLRVE